MMMKVRTSETTSITMREICIRPFTPRSRIRTWTAKQTAARWALLSLEIAITMAGVPVVAEEAPCHSMKNCTCKTFKWTCPLLFSTRIILAVQWQTSKYMLRWDNRWKPTWVSCHRIRCISLEVRTWITTSITSSLFTITPLLSSTASSTLSSNTNSNS
jgi:hypothetical protein